MSSSSEEDGPPQQLNGKVENVDLELSTVPLLQFSTVVVPATSVTPAFLERHQAICSACRKHVPHLRTRRLRVHPTLCTVVCRTCEEKLIAVLGSPGGIDAARCQWCVNPRPQEWEKLEASRNGSLREEGGRKTDGHDDGGVHCSDTRCGQFVCRSCLRANLTREQLALVRSANDSGQWKCFRCDSQQILGHQLYAATIAEYARLRRRPVLLPTAAASLSLPADQPPQPQLQPSSGDGGPPAYGQQQLNIEQLGSRARSLVEACALSSVGPAGFTAVTHCLQDLVMWAQHILAPENLPVLGTAHQTKSVPASSGHGEQATDVDDKSAVINALRQQKLNDLVPGENPLTEKCAPGNRAAVRVEGPDQVAPELDQPMSPPRSPAAAAATQAAEPLQPPPEAEATRTSSSLENRLDATPASASTSKLPPSATVASANASGGTTNVTSAIHVKTEPPSADDLTQILPPAVEDVCADECPAKSIPFRSTENSTASTSAVARTSRSNHHNSDNNDNKEDDFNDDNKDADDDNEDSCDSNATMAIPLTPNKRFCKQKLKVEIEEKAAKEGENGSGFGSRSSGPREARQENDNDDCSDVHSLLADLEPRRLAASSVQVSDNADNDTTTRAREGVKKAKTKADKADEPFASSSDDEMDLGEPSQPGDLGPIVVLSDCDGVSDLLSEDEEDGAASMRAVDDGDDDEDDGGTSPPEANGLRTSESSTESSPERRQASKENGAAEDADHGGESSADNGQRCKRSVRKGLPTIPLEHGVTEAAVAEDDDDDDNDDDVDRYGGEHSKNGDVDDDNSASAESDTSTETDANRQLQNDKTTKAKGRKRRSPKARPDSPSSSGKNQKRPRLESNRSTSEDELELSPVQSNLTATGAAPAANDNKPRNSDKNKSTASRQIESVLISSDSDDDVLLPTHGSDASNGRSKQTRINNFMPTSKKFAKQIIKEEIDSCVISSDDDSGRPSKKAADKDHGSPHGQAKPKQEPPTPSGSGTPAGRRNIRDVMDESHLSRATREANAAERERRQRIDELQKKYNQFERRIEASGSDGAKCVLEFDLKTKQPLVEVHPVLSRRLKSHQRDGVKFLYRNLVETVEQLKKDASRGAGAILGHCMGLGKTFQVVCLIHTFLTHPLLKEHFKTILVICPLNVINAWCSEINQWVRRDNAIMEKFPLYNLHTEKDSGLRISLLAKWTRSGGVLLVTPSLLTALLGSETDAGKRRRQRQEASSKHGMPTSKSLTSCGFGASNSNRPRHDAVLLGKFKKYLCDPGASVVVVDEGHTLKKSDTQVTQIVQMMQTRRKVLLTGTPLQNNLTEYYTMVSIVSPGLLGTRNEFKNRFENPIMNGQYKNSTSEDIRKMRRRASVLNKLLDTVVQRRDMSVLASILPPRQDYVLTIRLSPLQERLYEEFLGMLIARAEEQATNSGPSFRRLLQDYVLLRSTWTHPKLLTMPPKTYSRKQQVVTVSDMLTFDTITPEQDNRIAQKDWYKPHLEGKDLDDIALGPKLFILFDIIQQCALIGDKLVVFCTQLSAIDLIEYLLRLMHENHIGMHGWVKEKDYFRMDGSTTAEDRQKYFEMFNDPDRQRARLFLVSTKAGKLGSTLIGANRMVLLDTSWNPADDNQAVYRIYRIGQVKPVYIYRFVSLGTMEEKMYARNILKESTGYRVLDDSNMERHFTHEDVRDLYKFTRYEDTEKVIPHVPKDCLLAELILRHKDNIVKVHEHQQMLQNLEDDLSEEDRRLAWEEYQREKDAPPGVGSTASAAGVASLRAPPILYVAEQLLAQVARYTVMFNNATTTDQAKRDILGPFLKKAKQAMDIFEQVRNTDQQTLAECIRTMQPAHVVAQLVQRIQLVANKINALRASLIQINEYITKSNQTPIRRM